MMKRGIEIEPLSEEAAEQIAHIVGSQSAAALALADLQRRRAEGEHVGLYFSGGMILVGPAITDKGREALAER